MKTKVDAALRRRKENENPRRQERLTLPTPACRGKLSAINVTTLSTLYTTTGFSLCCGYDIAGANKRAVLTHTFEHWQKVHIKVVRVKENLYFMLWLLIA